MLRIFVLGLVLVGLVAVGGIWSYCLPMVILVLSAVLCFTRFDVLFNPFSVLSSLELSLPCSAPLLFIWGSTILMWSVMFLVFWMVMPVVSLLSYCH